MGTWPLWVMVSEISGCVEDCARDMKPPLGLLGCKPRLLRFGGDFQRRVVAKAGCGFTQPVCVMYLTS